MPRFKCEGFSVDSAGNILGSATVTAYEAATSNLAICYASESGAALAGSATTSNATTGYFEFWIDFGDYASTQKFKYIVSKTGYTSVTVDNIQIIPYVYTEIVNARGSLSTLDARLDVAINENGTLKSGAVGLVDLTGNVLAVNGTMVFENGTDGTDAYTIAEVRAENGDALVTSGTNRANSGINVGTATVVTLTATGAITASGGVVGALTGDSAGTHTGDVVGNVTGNLTGNVTGNVTGDLTGKASQVLISGSTASDGTHFQPMRGQYRNLVMSCTGNTQVTVTADELVYHDAAADTRTAIRKTAFSNIADISTGVALNGLAVGLTEANTWYYIYAVTDGTNQKLCLSTVSSDLGAPTAFSGAWAGYTHWCRLGAVYNDGSGNFIQFKQIDNSVSISERFTWFSVSSTGGAWSAASENTEPPVIAKRVLYNANYNSNMLGISPNSGGYGGVVHRGDETASSNGMGIFATARSNVSSGSVLYSGTVYYYTGGNGEVLIAGYEY